MSLKKIKYIAVGSIALVLIGMIIAFNIVNKKNESKNEISMTGPVIADKIADFTEIMRKLTLQQSTIEKFQQTQELIVFETDLTQNTTWNESWGNLDMFKKLQNINFYGKGMYTVDLKQIEQEDIEFDHNLKKIYVNSPKPQIKSIEIDESQTTYSLPEKGIFRFGDIKLTPAQNQMITQEVKAQMTERLNDTDMYNKALIGAENSIKNLMQKIIANTTFGSYDIVIVWK